MKRDVRGAVLCVAAFITTMNLVAMVIMIFGAFVDNPSLLQYSLTMSESDVYDWALSFSDALNESVGTHGGLGSLVGMLCGLPWFFIIRGKKFFTTDITKTNSRVKPLTILFLFVLILAVQFVMSMVQIGLDTLFPQLDGSIAETTDSATASLASSFWGVLYIVIVGPICEELVFRGAVMRHLEKYGANFALIISSLLFGLYHMILFQSIFAIFVGLILGYTAGRFSLKWAMVLHMANNGMAVLSLVLASEVYDMALGFSFFASFILALVVLILKRNMLVAQKQAGAPSELNVYARAFTSPWLIIYLLVTLGTGISLIGVA